MGYKLLEIRPTLEIIKIAIPGNQIYQVALQTILDQDKQITDLKGEIKSLKKEIKEHVAESGFSMPIG